MKILFGNKLSTILILTFSILAQICYSQDGVKDTIYTPDNVMHINQTPLYPGKTNALYNDIANNFKIPKKALKDTIHGQLIIEIAIDKFGAVTDAKIIKGIRDDVDNAAIKMTKKLKRFSPSTMDNKPVPFKLKIPLKI